MNQILYTENSKKRGQPLEIKTIVIIFAIAIIVFGIILTGQGVYGFIQENNEKTNTTMPAVMMQQEGNKIKLQITHDKIIDKIIYSFSETEEVVLQGKGRNTIEETINLNENYSTLNIKITDIEGKTATYSKEYTIQNTDTVKPEIELLVENSKVKIVAKDETALDHILYYWNDEQETKVEVREDSPKQIEEKISILKGENTLTVVAVDKNENETVKEQTFKGAKKPTIEMTRDNDELIIKVTDEEGVKKIEYTLNGVYYSTDPNNSGASLNMKEVEFRQKLATGSNTITIKAYNMSDLTEEVSGETSI